MTLLLGIDAAWTATEPSGVALVSNASGQWRCLAVAPSYNSFVALAAGNAVDWTARPLASAPDPKQLLTAAHTLAGAKVDLVTVDMPIATVPFDKRRKADDVVSADFGARHCGPTHPPKKGPVPKAQRLLRRLPHRAMPWAHRHRRTVVPAPARGVSA